MEVNIHKCKNFSWVYLTQKMSPFYANDLLNWFHCFRAVTLLYEMGLVVEPSGAAAVAAVLSEKVPDVAGKRVVAFITGGNVSPHELERECEVRI